MNKINGNQINDFDSLRAVTATLRGDTSKTSGNSSVENKATTDGADKLRFSTRAAESAKLLDELKELPDVRQAKVNELRERIAANDYKPSSATIADAILRDEASG